MKSFGWKRWLMLSGFLAALVFTGFFAVRTFQPAANWRRHQDEKIRPWMRLGYVARTHHVPPSILHAALGLPDRPDRRPIRAIARSQQRQVGEVIEVLEQAIEEAHISAAQLRTPPGRDSITDRLLSALSVYGLPVLFAILVITAIGLPFPVSFLLVAAGSFVEQGEMKFIPVIIVASLGAILGDNAGYFLARWGGRRAIVRISRGVGGETRVRKAEQFSKRWGSTGIFLSRWLVSGLGPWINLTSGIARYPWQRFLFWDVTGEFLWVVIYVTLGYVFSNRVQTIADVLSNFAWVIVGLLIAGILGWKLLNYARSETASPITREAPADAV
jgi:membrane protein DedA with SNARE-associated domain